MTELLPCPFCGCKVAISKREDIWEFQHPKNDCFLGRLAPYTRDVEDATERWNRRSLSEDDVLAIVNGWLDCERNACDLTKEE